MRRSYKLCVESVAIVAGAALIAVGIGFRPAVVMLIGFLIVRVAGYVANRG